MADHAEAGRHVLENFGDVFTELGQRAAALRTGVFRRFVDLGLAWKMIWK